MGLGLLFYVLLGVQVSPKPQNSLDEAKDLAEVGISKAERSQGAQARKANDLPRGVGFRV